MPAFTFYRLDTGELLPQRYSGPERGLQANTPPSCGAVPGHFDQRARRVVNGQVQEWQPPQPQETPRWGHEWNEQRHCWDRLPGVGPLRATARAALQRAIEAQERMQARDVRELLLRLADGSNVNAEAARLRTKDQRIEAVRQDLQQLPAASRGQLLALILM